MMWIFLACSSANYELAGTADMAESYDFADSGTYGTEAEEEAPYDEDAALLEEAKWWKLSADLVLANDSIEVSLTRDIFSENMDFICEQTLVVERVLQFDSPFGGDERWFSVNLDEIQDSDCPLTRSETEIQFGVGPLISDLAVATEMVEWEDSIDPDIWADVSPMGAYVLDADSIVGYGLSYSATTEAEAEWIHMRPIYSFAW